MLTRMLMHDDIAKMYQIFWLSQLAVTVSKKSENRKNFSRKSEYNVRLFLISWSHQKQEVLP